MPLLSPIKTAPTIRVEDVQEVLQENAIEDPTVSQTLNDLGGTVADACETLVTLMRTSNYEGLKRNVALDILKLHGVMKKDEGVNDNRIQIVIHTDDKNVEDIFCPQRNVINITEESRRLQ